MINILSFSQRKKREKKTFLRSQPSQPEFTYLSALNLFSPCVIYKQTVDGEKGVKPNPTQGLLAWLSYNLLSTEKFKKKQEL
jgi:hypothetical protein